MYVRLMHDYPDLGFPIGASRNLYIARELKPHPLIYLTQKCKHDHAELFCAWVLLKSDGVCKGVKLSIACLLGMLCSYNVDSFCGAFLDPFPCLYTSWQIMAGSFEVLVDTLELDVANDSA